MTYTVSFYFNDGRFVLLGNGFRTEVMSKDDLNLDVSFRKTNLEHQDLLNEGFKLLCKRNNAKEAIECAKNLIPEEFI